MKRLNLALAQTFEPFTHDKLEFFRDTVPFCREGISRWCDLSPLEHAEFLHVGQVNCTHPYPFPVPKGRVIADLEGDEIPGTFREEFRDQIVSASCSPPEWRSRKVFVRPTFSRLLVDRARNDHRTFNDPLVHRMSFVGKTDTHGVRNRMVEACMGLPCSLSLVSEWNGLSPLGGSSERVFEESMKGCSISLCPQGQGIATARLYESCFYGRFPVVIGKVMMVGEDLCDTSFAIQISADLSQYEMRKKLEALSIMPLTEAIERGREARHYFDSVVRPYFEDPTLRFLEWLEITGLRNRQ